MPQAQHNIGVAQNFVALQLQEQDGDGGDGSVWLHLFTVGTHLKDTWREFTLSQNDLDAMIALQKKKRKRKRYSNVMLDYNHLSAFGLSADSGIAAGWLVESDGALQKRNNGRELWGRFTLTDRAREQIKNNEWRYISPEFIPRKSALDNKTREPELLAAALTNRPATRLEKIDSTKLNLTGSIIPSKEENMTLSDQDRDAIVAGVVQSLRQEPNILLNAQTQPQANAANDDIKAAIADALKPLGDIKTVITDAMKPMTDVSTKLSEFVDGQDEAAKVERIETTLSKHTKRGAVQPKEIERVKPLILGAADFEQALKDQDEFYASLPDGDSKDEKDQKAKGEDNADGELKLSFDQSVKAFMKDGKSEPEAIELSIAKHGDEAFAAWNTVIVDASDKFYQEAV